MRSGTLNVPGIVGFGKACQLCAAEMPQQTTHVKTLRDTLEKAVLQLEETFINGAAHLRLPNTSNIAF